MTKFNNLQELSQDQYFIDQIKIEIQKIVTNREIRPMPKPGFKYRRTGIDRMIENGRFNREYFTGNILAIWAKSSLLNAEERTIIQYICAVCARNTAKFYETPVTE